MPFTLQSQSQGNSFPQTMHKNLVPVDLGTSGISTKYDL